VLNLQGCVSPCTSALPLSGPCTLEPPRSENLQCVSPSVEPGMTAEGACHNICWHCLLWTLEHDNTLGVSKCNVQPLALNLGLTAELYFTNMCQCCLIASPAPPSPPRTLQG
jgi:hypothetical protein